MLKILFSILFFSFFSTLGFSKEIYVMCYFKNENMNSSVDFFPLVNQNSELISLDALYDKHTKTYAIKPSDFQSLLNLCKEKLKAHEGFTFNELKAIEKSYYNGYLGKKYSHYPLVGKLPHVEQDIIQLLQTLVIPLLHNQDHHEDIDCSGEFRPFYKQFESLSKENLIKDFVIHQVEADFVRQGVDIFKDKKLLHSQRFNKIYNQENHIYEGNSYSPLDIALIPFNFLYEYFSSRNKGHELEIKKNISMALYSRTQGFDAPDAIYLVNLFQSAIEKGYNIEIGNNNKSSGPTIHKIDILSDKEISLTTSTIYTVGVPLSGLKMNNEYEKTTPIFFISAKRKLKFNLVTGEITVEKHRISLH